MAYEDHIARIKYLGAEIRDLARRIPGAESVEISTTGKIRVTISAEYAGILLKHNPVERNGETVAEVGGVELRYPGRLPQIRTA